MSKHDPIRILLIGGSLRQGSVNAAVLATIERHAPADLAIRSFDRLGDLPHFNPDLDHDPLPDPVAALREAIDQTDAVIFSTPEYAGSLPGSFKNLLDWCVGRGFLGLPAGWINPSSHGGAKATYATLRSVISYIDGRIIESAAIDIPVPRHAISAEGIISDDLIVGRIIAAVTALAEHVRQQQPDPA